jgi:arylsulfatase A-like enzyme
MEESVRVPMIISFPGRIKENVAVDQAVGQIDLFATIMDYLGASDLDESDGSSLRRYIEGTSTNDKFDERIVVAEYDTRHPLSSDTLSGKLAYKCLLSVSFGSHS